jgi:hypothetical protein
VSIGEEPVREGTDTSAASAITLVVGASTPAVATSSEAASRMRSTVCWLLAWAGLRRGRTRSGIALSAAADVSRVSPVRGLDLRAYATHAFVSRAGSGEPARLCGAHGGDGGPYAVVGRCSSGEHGGVVVPGVGDPGALTGEPLKDTEQAERVVDGTLVSRSPDRDGLINL